MSSDGLTEDGWDYPVIKAVELDIRFGDDEMALSDFILDIDSIIAAVENIDLSESTPDLLRQLLAAIQVGWTAAGVAR